MVYSLHHPNSDKVLVLVLQPWLYRGVCLWEPGQQGHRA